MSVYIPDRKSEATPDTMPGRRIESIPSKSDCMPDRMPKICQKECQKEYPNICKQECQEIGPKDCQQECLTGMTGSMLVECK